MITGKTGISIGKGDRDNIGSLVCYGGIADEQTRDVKAHALAGKKIKSPKVFLGFLKIGAMDLKRMQKSQRCNCPSQSMEKAVPFGWNRLGGITIQSDL